MDSTAGSALLLYSLKYGGYQRQSMAVLCLYYKPHNKKGGAFRPESEVSQAGFQWDVSYGGLPPVRGRPLLHEWIALCFSLLF